MSSRSNRNSKQNNQNLKFDKCARARYRYTLYVTLTYAWQHTLAHTAHTYCCQSFSNFLIFVVIYLFICELINKFVYNLTEFFNFTKNSKNFFTIVRRRIVFTLHRLHLIYGMKWQKKKKLNWIWIQKSFSLHDWMQMFCLSFTNKSNRIERINESFTFYTNTNLWRIFFRFFFLIRCSSFVIYMMRCAYPNPIHSITICMRRRSRWMIWLPFTVTVDNDKTMYCMNHITPHYSYTYSNSLVLPCLAISYLLYFILYTNTIYRPQSASCGRTLLYTAVVQI